MASLGTLAVNIVARTEKFSSGITKSLSQVTRFSNGVMKATKVVAAFGAATGVAGVALGTVLVKRQLDAVDAITKTSDRLGIQTERLVELQLAASEAGVETKALETGLIKLAKGLSEATEGRGTGLNALKTLGLSAADLRRRSVPEQLRMISDAMSKLTNQGDRVRVSLELFGRSGAPLLNMLAGGRAGMNEAAVAANKLGQVFSNDMGNAVMRANDALGRVALTLDGLMRQIAIRVSPVIEHLANQFVAFVTDGNRINKIADSMARGFVKAGAFIVRVFYEVKASIREVGGELFEILSQLPKFMIGDKGKEFQLKASDLRARGSLIRFSGNATADRFENAALGKLQEWMKSLQASVAQSDQGLSATSKPFSLPESVGGALRMVGKMIGQGTAAPGALAGLVAKGVSGLGSTTSGTDPGRSLQFAETGSVESYRQRAAIRRQAEGDKSMKKVAANTGDAAEGIKKLVSIFTGQLPVLMPANIGG